MSSEDIKLKNETTADLSAEVVANAGDPVRLDTISFNSKVYQLGGSEVVANPVVGGAEDELTSLEVNGTKYRIPSEEMTFSTESQTGAQDLKSITIGSDKWNIHASGGGGGTSVVANPSLSGDESELTGLEISGTKYKVPSGGGGGKQLYEHKIVFVVANGEDYYVCMSQPIITDSNKQIKMSDFDNYYDRLTFTLMSANSKTKAFMVSTSVGTNLLEFYGVKTDSTGLNVVCGDIAITPNQGDIISAYDDSVTAL